MEIIKSKFQFWQTKNYQERLEAIEKARLPYLDAHSVKPRLLRNCKPLVKYNVEYLIVGGYAVGIHGYPRYTGDLDIFINPTEENAIKVLKCVEELGYPHHEYTKQDFMKTDCSVQFGSAPLKMDFLTDIPSCGLKFIDLYKNKIELNLDGLILNFISFNDLILNKKACIRPKDKIDLENLN